MLKQKRNKIYIGDGVYITEKELRQRITDKIPKDQFYNIMVEIKNDLKQQPIVTVKV